MKRRIVMSFIAVMSLISVISPVKGANENWRDPYVTRIMKTIAQDPTYTDAVLTDLDRNGIPEVFVI